jgi:hypothetical protein
MIDFIPDNDDAVSDGDIAKVEIRGRTTFENLYEDLLLRVEKR